MAKLDPKDIIARNKVLLGVYVIALLPIVLWVPVVGRVKGKPTAGPGEKPADNYEAAKRALTAASSTTNDYYKRIKGGEGVEPLYTRTDVERLTARRELYQTQLGALGKIVNDADTELERWFEAFKTTPAGSEPKASDYQTEYARQCALLVETYKPFVTSEAGDATFVFSESPPANDMRKYQKRFWIQEAVLMALQEASKSAGWSPDVQKELDKPENQGRALGLVKPIRLAARFDFPPPPAGVMAPAAGTPKPPVEPIPASIVVECPLPRLPLIVRELLARKIPLRVTSVKVDKAPFMFRYSQPPGVRLEINGQDGLFDQDYYTLPNIPDKDLYVSQERWIPEPNVRIEMRLEAFDFNKIDTPAEGH
jgi:hypothetical protein